MAQNLGLLAHNWLKKSRVIGMPCCGSDWKTSIACMAYHGSGWGSKLIKCHVVSRVGHVEGLVGSWRLCSICERSVWFCYANSTSLTVHGELNHIIVVSHHMFNLVDRLAWVNVGRGCYKILYVLLYHLLLVGNALKSAFFVSSISFRLRGPARFTLAKLLIRMALRTY